MKDRELFLDLAKEAAYRLSDELVHHLTNHLTSQLRYLARHGYDIAERAQIEELEHLFDQPDRRPIYRL